MIGKDRPLKIMWPIIMTHDIMHLDNFQRTFGRDTLDVEGFFEWAAEVTYPDDGRAEVPICESCHADWYESHGDERYRVRCMEVAVYTVALQNWNGGYIGKFCRFHKPRVRDY